MSAECGTCEPVRLVESAAFHAETQGAALIAAGTWLDAWKGWEVAATSWTPYVGGWTLTLHMSR